jgi:hypothetical protein
LLSRKEGTEERALRRGSEMIDCINAVVPVIERRIGFMARMIGRGGGADLSSAARVGRGLMKVRWAEMRVARAEAMNQRANVRG